MSEGKRKYGDVVFKLKDEVKARAVLAWGDSAQIGIELFNGKKSSGNFQTLYKHQNTPIGPASYYEVMIWGPLSIDDVEFIVMKHGGSNKPGRIWCDRALKDLKALRLPIYLGKRDDNSRRFEVDSILYKPKK